MHSTDKKSKSVSGLLLLAGGVVFPLLFTNSNPLPPVPAFTDISISSGIVNPELEVIGSHGAAFADVNGDSLPDLYFSRYIDEGSMTADLFFLNQDGNTFQERAGTANIADIDGGSHGANWADLDNDGDFDLVNATTALGFSPDGSPLPGPNDMYRNDGNSLFVEIHIPDMESNSFLTRGLTVLDIEADGDLDLYFINGWKGDGDPPTEKNELYMNSGAFLFTSSSAAIPVAVPAGQGATAADINGDGMVDLISCNRDGDLNVLINDQNGGFTVVDPSSIGINDRAYSGVTAADIDNDSDLDLLLVDYFDRGLLYQNQEGNIFQHIQTFTGIDGFMGSFGDFNHDGFQDLYFAGDDVLYLNRDGSVFVFGSEMPVTGIDDPRTSALADIDGDGDLDIAVSADKSRNFLFQNDYNAGNWLKLQLTSPSGQAGAFGSKVTLLDRSTGESIGMRQASGAYGYMGQDDPVLHFGLGNHTSVDVKVVFLEGSQVWMQNVLANQLVHINASSLENPDRTDGNYGK
jgi:hypothetical protein